MLTNVKTNEETTLPVHGLFVAIGHVPNTDVFTRHSSTPTTTGYLKTVGFSTYTNVEGVFACGDVQDHVYRQAITAAGSGCMAAIDCERWLESVAALRLTPCGNDAPEPSRYSTHRVRFPRTP